MENNTKKIDKSVCLNCKKRIDKHQKYCSKTCLYLYIDKKNGYWILA